MCTPFLIERVCLLEVIDPSHHYDHLTSGRTVISTFSLSKVFITHWTCENHFYRRLRAQVGVTNVEDRFLLRSVKY